MPIGIPGAGHSYVDVLHRENDDQVPVPSALVSANEKSWHQKLAPNEVLSNEELQTIEKIGGPSRTRTYDPLIMSQLL